MPDRLGTGSSASKLKNYLPLSQKGEANGVAELDSAGFVPISQLPDYVNDFQVFESISFFPPIGDDDTAYCDASTGAVYRWNGLTYVILGGERIAEGLDKEIQFNDGGVVGSSADFKFDKNFKTLVLNRGNVLPSNPLAIGGNIDSYLQVNIQNKNIGISSSSDYVATADNGDDENNYIDLGINGSNYVDEEYSATEANDGYIVQKGGDLVLITSEPGEEIRFFTDGTKAENLRGAINTDGFSVPEGNTYKIGNFNVLDLIAEASNKTEEDALFALGAKIVIRTDLL
jgi:hypothetical protein